MDIRARSTGAARRRPPDSIGKRLDRTRLAFNKRAHSLDLGSARGGSRVDQPREVGDTASNPEGHRGVPLKGPLPVCPPSDLQRSDGVGDWVGDPLRQDRCRRGGHSARGVACDQGKVGGRSPERAVSAVLLVCDSDASLHPIAQETALAQGLGGQGTARAVRARGRDAALDAQVGRCRCRTGVRSRAVVSDARPRLRRPDSAKPAPAPSLASDTRSGRAQRVQGPCSCLARVGSGSGAPAPSPPEWRGSGRPSSGNRRSTRSRSVPRSSPFSAGWILRGPSNVRNAALRDEAKETRCVSWRGDLRGEVTHKASCMIQGLSAK